MYSYKVFPEYLNFFFITTTSKTFFFPVISIQWNICFMDIKTRYGDAKYQEIIIQKENIQSPTL